jgi:hypothetical protein
MTTDRRVQRGKSGSDASAERGRHDALAERIARLQEQLAQLKAEHEAIAFAGARSRPSPEYPEEAKERAFRWIQQHYPPERERQLEEDYYETCFKHFMRRVRARHGQAAGPAQAPQPDDVRDA